MRCHSVEFYMYTYKCIHSQPMHSCLAACWHHKKYYPRGLSTIRPSGGSFQRTSGAKSPAATSTQTTQWTKRIMITTMTITYHNHNHNHRNTIAVCVCVSMCIYVCKCNIYIYMHIYLYGFHLEVQPKFLSQFALDSSFQWHFALWFSCHSDGQNPQIQTLHLEYPNSRHPGS